ncbi:MAG: hypothetical protein MK078_13640 [Crocinitomicaceae bacterium]|nr:hypothetical protein [Crocinitomicaceae bacterium]
MNLEGLLGSVRRSNRTKIIVGVFIAALGFFMIGLGVATDDAYGDMNEAGIILVWVFSLLFVVTGILMIALSVKSNKSIATRQHPFLRAMDNPNDISVIWVYEHIVKSSATANHSLHIYFSNGKMEGVVPKKKDIQPLMQYLMQTFPSARFGFSEDIKKEFQAQKKRFKKKEIDRIVF